MDKKNTTIGVVLLLAAFAMLYLAPKPVPPPPQLPPPATVTQPTSAGPEAAPTAPGQAMTPVSSAAASTVAATINRDSVRAVVTTLANDVIEARLTNFGGAIRDVAFKKYPAIQGRPEPYSFNQLHEDPILALTDFPGLDRNTVYELVSSSANEVVYRAVLDGRIEVTRRYALAKDGEPGGDPYRLRHETTLRNLTATTMPLPRAALSLGTATLTNSNDTGQYLNVASYNGDKSDYTAIGEFDAGFGWFVSAGRPARDTIEKPSSTTWAAVKNQFFVSVYTPEKPGIGVIAKRLDLTKELPFADSTRANVAITGAARFDLPALEPNGSFKLAGMLYVGPKEYRRLARFGQDEDKVMQYDAFFFNRIFLSGYIAPFLNTLLTATHGWVGNWGVAVILMTIILKLVTLPFTFAASRSAKRMGKLQPEMQAIREKFKDNPQKQQAATMELFKKHKVNPVGGCLPILITMPLFIGFFAMLQGPAELRFAPFLWAHDLSAPDTVGRIFGLPINIMPLLMGATMIYQMRLTPTPTVDNAQMKMMKFMPIIFIIFCYNFSCALSLYSTINGLFTIGQQLVINRMKDPADAPPSASGPGGKSIKNVTPPKKK